MSLNDEQLEALGRLLRQMAGQATDGHNKVSILEAGQVAGEDLAPDFLERVEAGLVPQVREMQEILTNIRRILAAGGHPFEPLGDVPRPQPL